MSENASSTENLERGLDRRQFMGRAAALGMTTALTAMPSRLWAEEPRKGGHLKIGVDAASSTDTLDPGFSTAAYVETVNFSWGNCLVELDEQANAIPELAVSWEPNADGTTWVFKLRKGVTFHNGKDFVAEDVVHTINHHRSEDSKSGAKGVLKNISDIKATAPDEVTVVLSSASADLPFLFSATQLQILPSTEKPDAGIGTGAYIIENFEPGVVTLGKRNPNYWKEGRAHADSIEIIALNDHSARVSAVQTGSVHIVPRVEPKIVGRLKEAGIQIIDVPSAGHYTFPMRCDIPPYDQLDVRLALKHAINREDLLERILFGYGTIGNDNPIPLFDPFFAGDIPQRTYDPDKAKFHIKKAGGLSAPIELSVSEAAFPGATDAAILFKEHAAKAGIDLQVKRTPNDGYWSEVWLKAPFCGAYWSGKPTADLMLTNVYSSTTPWNDTAWKRPDFDDLLIKARGELNTERRKQMYHDLQMMIWEDGGQIIPVFNNWIFAAQPNVAGLVRCPVATGRRMSEQLYLTA